MAPLKFNFLRGIGNEHFDVARMGWALSIVAGIVYSGVHMFMHGAFNIIEFGTGMGALLAAGAGGVAMKDTAVARAANASSADDPA
jgi:hypothetical protein